MKRTKEDFYNMLKESGELNLLFDGMEGKWKIDKEKFCNDYDNVLSSLTNGEIPNDITTDT